MRIYTKQEFINNNVAIHTLTREGYNKLMKRLDKAGFEWSDGDKLTSCNEWFLFGKSTCITCDINQACRYGFRQSYESKDYTIIKPHEINLVEDNIKKKTRKATVTTIKADNQAKQINTPFVSDTNVANKKYTLNDLKAKKIAVHLPTEEEEKELVINLPENCVKLTVKYKGKEKVITRDDFEEEKKSYLVHIQYEGTCKGCETIEVDASSEGEAKILAEKEVNWIDNLFSIVVDDKTEITITKE